MYANNKTKKKTIGPTLNPFETGGQLIYTGLTIKICFLWLP
jgi:hypothetical protein